MGCGRPRLSNGEVAWSVGTMRCHQTIRILGTSKTSKIQVLVVEVISTPSYAGCQHPVDKIRSLDAVDRVVTSRWAAAPSASGSTQPQFATFGFINCLP
jgi:hypothetical protein